MSGLQPVVKRFSLPIATALLRKLDLRAPLEVRCCRTHYC
jgi:hypothetical protein